MEDLEKCPFCGGKLLDVMLGWVACTNCWADGPIAKKRGESVSERKAEGVRLWNARAE